MLKKIGLAFGILVVVCAIVFSIVRTPYMERRCGEQRITAEKIQTATIAAAKLSAWLDASGAKVVAIARRGQDLTQYSIEFSHVAYAKKVGETWQVHHLLNICPTNQGRLAQETLTDFLAIVPGAYRVGIAIPNEVVQTRLAAILGDAHAMNMLFEPHYNAIAYPFGTGQQNSNGWVLEIFAKALAGEPITTRADALAWLEAQHYTPEAIEVSRLKRLGVNLFVPNMHTKGQPQSLLKQGIIWLNGSDSTLNFIANKGLAHPTCTNKLEHLDKKICVLSLE